MQHLRAVRGPKQALKFIRKLAVTVVLGDVSANFVDTSGSVAGDRSVGVLCIHMKC